MEGKQVNILEYLDEICPVCHQQFDNLFHVPMMLCNKQHLSCKKCVDQLMKQVNVIKCPECRQVIKRKNIIVFRRFYKIIQQNKNVKAQKFKDAEHFEKKLATINESIDLKRQAQINLQLELEQVNSYKKFKDNQYEKLQKGMLNQAVKNFKNKELKRCINVCQLIIQNNPKQSGCFLGLGSKEEQIGYYEQREYEWFQMKDYGLNISPYDLLNLCFLISKSYDKQWYQNMVQNYPDNVHLQYGLVLAEHNSGNLDRAQELCNKIISIDPSFSKPYQILAFIAHSRQQQSFDFAIAALQRQNNNLFAKYLLACQYSQVQDYQEFEEIASEIMTDEPTFMRIINLKGQTLFQVQKYEQSLQCFEYCIKKNSFYHQPFINKSKCLVALQRQQQSLEFVLKYRNMLIDNPQFLFQTGEVYTLMKRYQLSINYYQKCYSLNPMHEEVNYRLAYVYVQQNDYLKAVQFYKRHLKHYPDCQYTCEQIAGIYEHLKQYKQTNSWLEKECQISKDENINLRIAKHYINMREFSRAIQKLYICIEKGAKADDIYPYLLQVLRLQSKYEDRIRQAKKWVAASPQNKIPLLILENLQKNKIEKESHHQKSKIEPLCRK